MIVTVRHQPVETELGGNGRVLLRPSGTEPVLRVMVEAQDAALAERQARQLAAVVDASARSDSKSLGKTVCPTACGSPTYAVSQMMWPWRCLTI